MAAPPPKAKKYPEQMTEQELLAGIYRAVYTIRGIVIFWLILSLLGVLAFFAAAGQTTN